MSSREASPAEQVTGAQLWIVLARAYISMSRYLQRSMEPGDLNLTDFAVLEVLLHRGPLTMSQIAGKILLANASVTSAVDRLEKRELVTRNSAAEDRRVRTVALTSRGRRWITKAFAEHIREIDRVTDLLSATKRASLRQGLKTLGLAAERMTPAERPRTARTRETEPGAKSSRKKI